MPGQRSNRQRFYQYSAINEFSRMCCIAAFEEHNAHSSAFSSARCSVLQLLNRLYANWQWDWVTNRFSHYTAQDPDINSFALTPWYTARLSAVTVKIKNVSTQRHNSIPLPTICTSMKAINTAQTRYPNACSSGVRLSINTTKNLSSSVRGSNAKKTDCQAFRLSISRSICARSSSMLPNLRSSRMRFRNDTEIVLP